MYSSRDKRSYNSSITVALLIIFYELSFFHRLDPDKVADIVSIVSKKCKVAETLVRSIITTKCSDENKMLNKRGQRNKENAVPKEEN